MTDYLLDTNVLMHLVNKAEGWQRIEKRLIELGSTRPFVSAVTVWEVSRLAGKSNNKTKKAAIVALQNLLTTFKVIPLTDHYAALAGSLHAYLANKGLTIGERDSMIAGTAMALDLVMVTDNTGEFSRVPGLDLQNWRKAN